MLDDAPESITYLSLDNLTLHVYTCSYNTYLPDKSGLDFFLPFSHSFGEGCFLSISQNTSHCTLLDLYALVLTVYYNNVAWIELTSQACSPSQVTSVIAK